MSRAAAPVQWALIGKRPGGRAYEVLECGGDVFKRDDFSAMNQRFSPGTPERLPQVTVARAASGDNAHLTLSIEEESEEHDAVGRDVVVTRLYCVPYALLAERAVSYEALYRACDALRLPAAGPAAIELPPPDPQSLADRMDRVVVRTAALLLTGGPVQVVGADSVPLLDRLRFVDAVTAILPYGMRTKFSAATWTSSTAEHQIRLAFARHERENAHTVVWNEPPDIPREADAALRYIDLVAGRSRLELLELMAGEKRQLGFGPADRREVLLLLNRAREPLQLPPPLPGGGESVADLLARCADALDGRADDLEDAVRRLSYAAGGTRAAADAAAHWEVIDRRRMLTPRRGVRAQDAQALYVLLVQLAFRHVDTAELAQIERAAGGLHQPLLYALYDLRGIASAEVQLTVGWKLGNKMLNSVLGGLGEAVLTEVAVRTADPVTAETACDALARRGGSEPNGELVQALQAHGYLAPVVARLKPDRPDEQRKRLTALLRAAYGSGPLGRAEFREVVGSRRDLATPALLGAALALCGEPDAWDVLVEEYLLGLLRGAGLGKDVDKKLPPPRPPAPAPTQQMGAWPPPPPPDPPTGDKQGGLRLPRLRRSGRREESGDRQNAPPTAAGDPALRPGRLYESTAFRMLVLVLGAAAATGAVLGLALALVTG